MERILTYLPIISLVIGSWALVNGILHDVFILLQGKKCDRDLLRLMMDGHILITCGIIQIIAYSGFKQNESWAYYVAGVACLSLLIYCGMIFPFLKSLGTIFLNLSLLVILIISYLKR